MIAQVENYLRRIETAESQSEKEKIGAELQAFYRTLSDEEYEFVKLKVLTPRLNELKFRMNELNELIEEVFSEKAIR